MIISSNPVPSMDEFQNLLNSSIAELSRLGSSEASLISTLKGNKLEPFVKDVLEQEAKGTLFQDSIELISGQKFPDIIAKKFYGVEVKSTTQNHWKTTGNSVLESTRVDGVERIFMLFGKLSDPIEFKCRPYEECLSEVVVTHSPRYLIDMDLELGQTIFDKIEVPYDTLRNKDNPIRPIVEYYRQFLKEGDDIWWMDNDKSSNIVIRDWSNLSANDRELLILKAMILFPEIFGNSTNKYKRLPAWLASNESVVCKNIRDLFSAGGQRDVNIDGHIFNALPRIFVNLFDNIQTIKDLFKNLDIEELNHFWGIKSSHESKLQDWANLIDKYSKSNVDTKNLDISKMILTSLK